MDRKEFLKILGASAFLSGASLYAVAGEVESEKFALKIKKVNLHFGLAKPIRILHVSDTHLTFADSRDNARKNKLAVGRRRVFGGNVEPAKDKMYLSLLCAADYAKKNGALLVHTGDVIDFTSKMNFDLVSKALKDSDYIFAAGNHEYSQYVGEAKEDDAYKLQSYEDVQKVFKNDIYFSSRIFGGVNFVAFDNVYYYINSDVKERLKIEVEKGYPIVLLCHIPFYTVEFYKAICSGGNKCPYLMGAPADKLALCDERRRAQQAPDAKTLEFIDFVKASPSIKAVLCGHVHKTLESAFANLARQYCVGTSGAGDAEEFFID